MNDYTKLVESLLNYVWIPIVTWFAQIHLRKRQEDQDRDSTLQDLKEYVAVAKATNISREEVTLIIEGRIASLEDKIDRISNDITCVIRALPKREGDE